MSRVQRFINCQSGEINYVNVILIIFLIIIAFLFWIYGIGMYQNFSLGHFAEGEAIKARETSNEDIRNNILAKAEEIGIDMSTFEVELSRHSSKMEINYSFERAIGIPGLSDKTVKFTKNIIKKYGDIDHFEDKGKVKKYN